MSLRGDLANRFVLAVNGSERAQMRMMKSHDLNFCFLSAPSALCELRQHCCEVLDFYIDDVC